MVTYDEIAAAVAETGMVARGGFEHAGGTVVVIGNIGGAMWPTFRREETPGADPLDRWTRQRLAPIARRFGADFIHPSDQPYQPIQQWAARADDVWPSPLGLLIHREYGLWHAYRGAFLFEQPVSNLPPRHGGDSPCVSCVDQPCLTTCPVEAFTPGGYEHVSCRGHVASSDDPDCLHDGCAARRACPVNQQGVYGHDQMHFHMRAFVDMPS